MLASKLRPEDVRECNSPALSLDAPVPGPDSPETSVHGAVVFRCVPASKQGGPCDHCATTGAWRAGEVQGMTALPAHLRDAQTESPRGLAPPPRWVGTAPGLVSGRCRRAAALRAPRAGTQAVLTRARALTPLYSPPPPALPSPHRVPTVAPWTRGEAGAVQRVRDPLPPDWATAPALPCRHPCPPAAPPLRPAGPVRQEAAPVCVAGGVRPGAVLTRPPKEEGRGLQPQPQPEWVSLHRAIHSAFLAAGTGGTAGWGWGDGMLTTWWNA